MIDKNLIEVIKTKLVEAYDPLEIYLFGSYAWGHPDKDSDLDLLIVIEKSSERSYKRPLKAYDALLSIDIPKDIVVYTKNEFDQDVIQVSSLCHKIKKEGMVIYAKA